MPPSLMSSSLIEREREREASHLLEEGEKDLLVPLSRDEERALPIAILLRLKEE